MDDENACLIIGPSWVGDMVMAQCLIKAVKRQHPDAPLDVMAPEWTAPLVERMAEVRRAIGVSFRHGKLDLGARRRVARAARGRYVVAYILPNSLKSALVPWLAGIPRRIGYLGEQRYRLLNDIRPLPPELKRRTARRFQALADQGPLLRPQLMVDMEQQRRLCSRWSLTSGDFVALMPGAEYGPSKQWPVERFAGFARRFLGAGRRVVVVGVAGDLPLGEQIAEAAPGTVNACGQTTLAEAVDLLAAAAVAVTNDSGLMHISAAVGTPVVAIYGSTSPDDTPPQSYAAVTVSAQVECSPCFERVCPYGHMNCMDSLSIEIVANAAGELIARCGAGPRLAD